MAVGVCRSWVASKNLLTLGFSLTDRHHLFPRSISPLCPSQTLSAEHGTAVRDIQHGDLSKV